MAKQRGRDQKVVKGSGSGRRNILNCFGFDDSIDENTSKLHVFPVAPWEPRYERENPQGNVSYGGGRANIGNMATPSAASNGKMSTLSTAGNGAQGPEPEMPSNWCCCCCCC